MIIIAVMIKKLILRIKKMMMRMMTIQGYATSATLTINKIAHSHNQLNNNLNL